ncbi:IS1 InsA protein [Escherichia coli]|nr:IS1 InsA protein [Escherichia coli]
MASVTVHCPRCHSAQVYRHGQNPKGRTCLAVVILLLVGV